MDNKVELVAFGLLLILNALNAATEHWSKASKLRKVLLFITEFVSFLPSKDSEKKIKLPGVVK